MVTLADWAIHRIEVSIHVSEDYLRPGYIAGDARNPVTGKTTYRVVFTDTPPTAFKATVNNEPIGYEHAFFTADDIEIVLIGNYEGD